MENEEIIYHVDLTDREMEQKFIRNRLGDNIYNTIKDECGWLAEHPIEVKCGMLYRSEVSLEKLKEDYIPKEYQGYQGYGLQRSRRYVVNNIPTGEYHVIAPGEVNDGDFPNQDGFPGYLVGTLKWTAETGDYEFKGLLISDEGEYIVVGHECKGNVNNDCDDGPSVPNALFFYWKDRGSMMPPQSSQYDFKSVEIENMAIVKFVQNVGESLFGNDSENT